MVLHIKAVIFKDLTNHKQHLIESLIQSILFGGMSKWRLIRRKSMGKHCSFFCSVNLEMSSVFNSVKCCLGKGQLEMFLLKKL